MKIKKRFAAMIAATVMALGTLGIDASASGNINLSSYVSNNAIFSYSGVDGCPATIYRDNNTSGNGAKYSNTFKATSTGAHAVSFTPATGSDTYVKFFVSNTSAPVGITIPKYVPGMPSTLSSSVSLDSTKKYTLKIVSSTSASKSGTFSINGVIL